jgi:hypothetical protein
MRTGAQAAAAAGRSASADEDNVRAAVGSFGHPGEEGMRNARMPGGFGGDGYNNYGEAMAARRTVVVPGAATIARAREWAPTSRADSAASATAATMPSTGRRQQRAGAGSAAPGRPQQLRRRSGNTRFGNDATGSRGEVRRGEHQGRGPKNYQRSDDRIREDTQSASRTT